MAKLKITYKEAIEEIEAIITRIESGEFDIDELGTQVKKVADLISICKDKLHKTEEEVENILNNIDKKV